MKIHLHGAPDELDPANILGGIRRAERSVCLKRISTHARVRALHRRRSRGRAAARDHRHIRHLGPLPQHRRSSRHFFRVISRFPPGSRGIHACFSLSPDPVRARRRRRRRRDSSPAPKAAETSARSACASPPDSDLPRGSRAFPATTGSFPLHRPVSLVEERTSSPDRAGRSGLLLIKLSCGTHAAADADADAANRFPTASTV